MKVFTLICALLVLACGAAEFYGWGGGGNGPKTPVSAIPALFGLVMLLGTLVALVFRRTGLQIAFLSALVGGFSGLGRLAPLYMKETLDWKAYPNQLILATSILCLVYVLVAAFCFLLVKRKPVNAGFNDEESPAPREGEKEGQEDEESKEEGAEANEENVSDDDKEGGLRDDPVPIDGESPEEKKSESPVMPVS